MENNVLRKVQLTQLEILGVLDGICKENDIVYYLAYGTLLGAVRHKGFIPWDDDLDLLIPRKDYDKLMEILPKELPEKYWLQNSTTDLDYKVSYAKIRKKGTLYKEKLQNNFPDEKCGIWIDIFPLDECNDDFLYIIRSRISRTIDLYLRTLQYNQSIFSNSRRYLPFMILLKCFTVNFIQKVQRYLIVGNNKNTTHFSMITDYNKKIKKMIFKKEWFKPSKILFEDKEYISPSGFEEILTLIYGDYMTPPPTDQRGGHSVSTDSKIIV